MEVVFTKSNDSNVWGHRGSIEWHLGFPQGNDRVLSRNDALTGFVIPTVDKDSTKSSRAVL